MIDIQIPKNKDGISTKEALDTIISLVSEEVMLKKKDLSDDGAISKIEIENPESFADKFFDAQENRNKSATGIPTGGKSDPYFVSITNFAELLGPLAKSFEELGGKMGGGGLIGSLLGLLASASPIAMIGNAVKGIGGAVGKLFGRKDKSKVDADLPDRKHSRGSRTDVNIDRRKDNAPNVEVDKRRTSEIPDTKTKVAPKIRGKGSVAGKLLAGLGVGAAAYGMGSTISNSKNSSIEDAMSAASDAVDLADEAKNIKANSNAKPSTPNTIERVKSPSKPTMPTSAVKKGATTALKTGARLLSKAALPLAVLSSAFDGYQGYNDTELHKEAFGLKEGEEASTWQKMKAGGASILSGLTFGLISPKKILDFTGLSENQEKKEADKKETEKAVEVISETISERREERKQNLSPEEVERQKAIERTKREIAQIEQDEKTNYSRYKNSSGAAKHNLAISNSKRKQILERRQIALESGYGPNDSVYFKPGGKEVDKEKTEMLYGERNRARRKFTSASSETNSSIEQTKKTSQNITESDRSSARKTAERDRIEQVRSEFSEERLEKEISAILDEVSKKDTSSTSASSETNSSIEQTSEQPSNNTETIDTVFEVRGGVTPVWNTRIQDNSIGGETSNTSIKENTQENNKFPEIINTENLTVNANYVNLIQKNNSQPEARTFNNAVLNDYGNLSSSNIKEIYNNSNEPISNSKSYEEKIAEYDSLLENNNVSSDIKEKALYLRNIYSQRQNRNRISNASYSSPYTPFQNVNIPRNSYEVIDGEIGEPENYSQLVEESNTESALLETTNNTEQELAAIKNESYNQQEKQSNLPDENRNLEKLQEAESIKTTESTSKLKKQLESIGIKLSNINSINAPYATFYIDGNPFISGIENLQEKGLFGKIGEGLSKAWEGLKNFFGGGENPNNTAEAQAANTGSNTGGNNFSDTGLQTNTGGAVSDELGSLMAKYESGGKGALAIGYDKNGGTSYGKFQLSSKQGSYQEWLKYIENKDELGAQIAQQLKSVGGYNTGSRSGAQVDAYTKLASQYKDYFEKTQNEYTKKAHFDPALRNIAKRNPELANIIQNDRGLQESLWSTAVQHGGGGLGKMNGATGIFLNAWKDMGGQYDRNRLIDSVYNRRASGGQWTNSEADIKKSVNSRYFRKGGEVELIKGIAPNSGFASNQQNNQNGIPQPAQTMTPAPPAAAFAGGSMPNINQNIPQQRPASDGSQMMPLPSMIPQVANTMPQNNSIQPNSNAQNNGGNIIVNSARNLIARAGGSQNMRYELNEKTRGRVINGTQVYDCSSFVSRALSQIGVPGIRDGMTVAALEPVMRKNPNIFEWHQGLDGLQAGDILIRATTRGGAAGKDHVAISNGGRSTLEANGHLQKTMGVGVGEYKDGFKGIAKGRDGYNGYYRIRPEVLQQLAAANSNLSNGTPPMAVAGGQLPQIPQGENSTPDISGNMQVADASQGGTGMNIPNMSNNDSSGSVLNTGSANEAQNQMLAQSNYNSNYNSSGSSGNSYSPTTVNNGGDTTMAMPINNNSNSQQTVIVNNYRFGNNDRNLSMLNPDSMSLAMA